MSKLSEALFAGNRELSESQVTEAVRNFTFETKDGETYDIPAATADDAITSFHRRFPVIQNEDIIAFYDDSDIHYCPISGEELDEFLDVGAPNINLNLDASGQSVGILGGKGGDADDEDEVDEGLVGDVAGGIGNAVDRIGKKLPVIGGLFEGTEDGFSVGDKVYYIDDDPKVPGEIVEIHEDGTCDVIVNDNSGDIVNVDMKMLDYWDDSQMECAMSEGCRINYEDDLVKVYDGNAVIYQGIEDYEPMRYEPWEWNDKDACYYLNQDGKTYKKVCFESKLTEDTVRKSNGKWTNRGDDGKEHGEFDTKAEADAQRRAMYASGYKGESKQVVKEDLVPEVNKEYIYSTIVVNPVDEYEKELVKRDGMKCTITDRLDDDVWECKFEDGYSYGVFGDELAPVINEGKKLTEDLDADGFDMLMDEIRKHNISIEDLEHAIEVIKDEEREADEVALKGLADTLDSLDSRLEVMSHPYDNVPKLPDGSYGREAWISNDPNQYLGYVLGISGDYNDRPDVIQVYLYDNDGRFKEMGEDFNIKDADKAVEVVNKLVNEIDADMDPSEVEAIGLKYLGR